MENAKVGHTVEFHGLKGSAHLNGTRGHLVKYLKKEKRWAVRCEDEESALVNARTENLKLVKIVDVKPKYMHNFGEPKYSPQPKYPPPECATTAAGETYYVADENRVRASKYDLDLLRQHEATAAAGDVDMQYTLSCSDNIVGPAIAFEWMRIAANNGHAGAQFNLGRSYETGDGVKDIDYKEAARWYQRSADQGYMESQCNLGLLYCKGRGVEQSYNVAKFWLGKAAAQGDHVAARELGMVRAALTAEKLGCGVQWSGREY